MKDKELTICIGKTCILTLFVNKNFTIYICVGLVYCTLHLVFIVCLQDTGCVTSTVPSTRCATRCAMLTSDVLSGVSLRVSGA